jgi:hypothetical protein
VIPPSLTVLFVTVIWVFNLTAQNNYEDFYIWFDSKIGSENTGLYNGTRFQETFQTKRGVHRYFLGTEFQNGNINYFGQPYFDVALKYDIYEDQVLFSIVKLIKDEIQSFEIEGHKFFLLQPAEISNSSSSIDGFYEILLEGKRFILYKKNKKSKREFIENETVFTDFKINNEYFIYVDDTYHKIVKKRDWIKVFPEAKKTVNDFYRSHKFLFKTDYEAFVSQLAEKINASSQIVKQ